MTLLLVLGALVLTANTFWLAHLLAHDDVAHRADWDLPRSHHPDPFAARSHLL